MKQRKGWVRLGIVTSVLILASLHIFLYGEHQAAISEWGVAGLKSKFFDCSSGTQRNCELLLGPYLFAVLAPLLVLWSLCLIATKGWARTSWANVLLAVSGVWLLASYSYLTHVSKSPFAEFAPGGSLWRDYFGLGLVPVALLWATALSMRWVVRGFKSQG